jgi:hypothetical protein
MFDAIAWLWPSAIFWFIWYIGVARVTTLASTQWDRLAVYLSPVLCLAVLWLRIAIVVDKIQGTWWLVVFEAAVLAVGSLALPLLGLNRYDVAERRNRGVGIAIVGAMLGLTLVCASAARVFVDPGRPLKEGAVFFAELLGIAGSAAFFVLAIAVDAVVHLSEAVSIDRDGGAAVRLAALLTALGLLVGQALEASPVGSMRSMLAFAAPQAFAAGVVALELAIGRRPRFGGADVVDAIMATIYLGTAGCATWLLQ